MTELAAMQFIALECRLQSKLSTPSPANTNPKVEQKKIAQTKNSIVLQIH